MGYFKITYLLLLFLLLTGSMVYVGPITLKLVGLVAMTILIIIHDRGFKLDKYIKLYSIFILMFGVSSYFAGYFENFASMFVSNYFASLVAWRATKIILEKDYKFISFIVALILFIGVLDGLFTISQFTNNRDWYSSIEDFFQFQSSVFYKERVKDIYLEEEIASIYLPGIFSNPIINGYYLASCSILSFYCISKYRNLLLYIFPLFFLVSVFMAQERSALLLSLLFVGIYHYKWMKSLSITQRLLVLVPSFVLMFYIGKRMIDFSEMYDLRYSELGLEADRDVVFSSTIEYLVNHPLLPNVWESIEYVGHAPHNILLNAYVYGGIVSFAMIMIILWHQFKIAIRFLLNKMTDDNNLLIILICTWFVFTLNGLVHNRSLITGEVFVWILWGGIISHPLLAKE